VNLAHHVVFATRSRQFWLLNPARERIHAYLGGIVRQCGGQSIRVNGPEDHHRCVTFEEELTAFLKKHGTKHASKYT